MTDTRDPRIAELVNRLVEQAPPAPPFPDEVTAPPDAPRRRVAIAGIALAAALVIASVVFVASRPKHDPQPLAPSTTAPSPSTPLIEPSALAVAADGTLYVGDLRSRGIITVIDGVVRRLMGVEEPRGLAFDRAGNLYVADPGSDTVKRFVGPGRVPTYAGNGTPGFSGDSGPATDASLNDPTALAFGPDGALYIADSGNGRVRRVAADGTISTFAGNGSFAQTGDGGPALDAGLDATELAFDGAGNLVVFHFPTKAIRRISPDGIISSLPEPLYAAGLATTPDGDVDVADYGSFGISRIWPGGTTFALPFRHSGRFRPSAIAVAPNGDVYVADDGRSQGGPPRILRVQPDGTSVDVTPGGRAEPPPPPFEDRTVARAVPHLAGVVGQREVPYAESIRSVRADGDVVVVSTSLVDTTRAAELWEAISRAIGCDDSWLFVRGYRVVLADGAVVAAPRPGFVYCAGT